LVSIIGSQRELLEHFDGGIVTSTGNAANGKAGGSGTKTSIMEDGVVGLLEVLAVPIVLLQ